MALLPIRARVLQYLSKMPLANVYDVMSELKSEYGDERQFTKPNFVDHLMALKANGLIDEISFDVDKQGELYINYKINQEGNDTINKYLPKKYR